MGGSKFTVFALFYFVFEGKFPSTSPRGAYIEGRFNGGFFALPVWGAYIWRVLYMEGGSFVYKKSEYYLTISLVLKFSQSTFQAIYFIL